MPDQRPVFQGDHPSNLIGWPTFQPSQLAGFSTVVNTFSRNAQELTNHVGRFLYSPTTSAKELSDDYVNELVRLLHNYLTAVTSLIDAQRVVMRHRWPSAKKGEHLDPIRDSSDDHPNTHHRQRPTPFGPHRTHFC